MSTPQAAPWEWTRSIPIEDLHESPLNPRVTFFEDGLRQLAASLAGPHGQLQPLVIRPIGENPRWVEKSKDWTGVDRWEVVDGHRRLRAAKIAGLKKLKCTVRLMDDNSTLSAMLVSNAQREDVSPSEQAAAVGELARAVGQEEAAKQVGWPLARVRDLLRLAALPAWFLAAVDAGTVPLSTAGVVAKVPGAISREKASACVLLGLGSELDLTPDDFEDLAKGRPPLEFGSEDGPLSVKDAKEFVRSRFSRQLKDAPFSRKSLTLVTDAGSCDACPKRAGNDPDLVREGVRADVCTDPECFEKKVSAYQAEEVAKAGKKSGASPFDGDWRKGQPHPRGWLLLDQTLAASEPNDPFGTWSGKKGEQKVSELLATAFPKGAPASVAFHPQSGKPVLLVRTKDARRAVEAAGLMGKKEKPKATASPKAGSKVGDVAGTADYELKLYRVTFDPAAMPVLEFDAWPNESPDALAEKAASAFMGWFDSVDWTADGPQLLGYEEVPEGEAAELQPRTCRACKCTEADCSQCVAKTGGPCHWVEWDLCSACDGADVRTPEPVAIDEPFAAAGDVVRTSYGTGPYVVKTIGRDGTRGGRPCYSLTLAYVHGKEKGTGPAILNGYQRQANGDITAANGDELIVLPKGSESGPTYWDWCQKYSVVDSKLDREQQRRWMDGLPPAKGPGGVHGDPSAWADLLPPAEPAPGPIVCKPVGEGMIRDIPGIELIDAESMEELGIVTLADLEAKCAELNRAGQTGPLNHQIYKVLLMPKGPFAGHIADQVANAIAKHLGHPTFGPEQRKAESAKGEPIEGLGLTAAELNAARWNRTGLNGMSPPPVLPRVKHVRINGRPHVVLFSGEGFPDSAFRSWELRPLWPRNIAAERGIAPTHADPLEGLAVEINVGFGKAASWNEHVIGSKGETRRLVNTPTPAKPAKKKAAKAKGAA